ncbi:probable GTP diphosphokinase RSH3, chloroplastic [Zingiber officinale]|uniref:probable GTP diphosphokinase RSH3, chloroplastic n=1 Tax=Zingiber officinale TaxID=94328 RepID=UPI001C4B5075|nr:probable GTP diphosphokinase RSH3, chloroplastic [Zingiber officinale]
MTLDDDYRIRILLLPRRRKAIDLSLSNEPGLAPSSPDLYLGFRFRSPLDSAISFSRSRSVGAWFSDRRGRCRRVKSRVFISDPDVPAGAIHASPPAGAAIYGFANFHLNSRTASFSAHVSSSAPRPIGGGLSRIFSSSAATRHVGGDDLRCDRPDELGSSYSYSSSPFKCGDHSPTSVFHGPCSGSGSSRSPPRMRNPIGSDWRTGKDGFFKRFVRNAVSPCLDYDSPSFSGSHFCIEEWPFGFDDCTMDMMPKSCFKGSVKA